jgi:hypothetical protein
LAPAGEVHAAGVEHNLGRLGGMGAAYPTLWSNLGSFGTSIAFAFRDYSDQYILGGWLCLVAFLVIWGWRRTEEEGPLWHRHRAELCVILGLVCYFALPMAIAGQWYINRRFALLAALFLPLAVRPVDRRQIRLGGLAAMALCLAVGFNATLHHRAFDREVGRFDEAIAAIPRGKRVMTLIFDPKGEVVGLWPYLHFGQYYMVRRGGTTSNTFAKNPSMPVRYLNIDALPQPSGWRPREFIYSRYGPHYDYFLVRDKADRDYDVFGPWARLVQPVFASGRWRVFRRIGPGARGTGEGRPPPRPAPR